VLSRRREIRASLSGPTEIQQVSARLLIVRQAGCQATMTPEVTLLNQGSAPVRDVRMHASLPTVIPSAFLAEIGELLPSQERTVRIPLGAVVGATSFPVFALLTYERGQEGRTRWLSFPAKAVQEESRVGLAETLACAAAPQDALAAHLAETLLSGARSNPPHPLAELAGILDSLGAARAGALKFAGTTQALPASAFAGPSMRNLLRTLSPEESEWTVVTASIASSLGIPAAIVAVGERPFAIVDTGIPFLDAFAAVANLERYRQTLAVLSPAGTLWLPLSGRVPPDGRDPSVWAVADALESLARLDASEALRAEMPLSGLPRSWPVSFPLVLPVITMRRSIAELQEALDSSLSWGRLP
jgi:hypothetical protein